MIAPTCFAYSTHLGFIQLTDRVAEHYGRAFSWERAQFHKNLIVWLDGVADAGAALDNIVIRLSQWKKWTGR